LKQKLYTLCSGFVKNIAVFFVGGALGIVFAILFLEPLLGHSISNDMGFGVIAVIPIMIIFYSFLFGIIGGILGVIVYHIVRACRRKKHS